MRLLKPIPAAQRVREYRERKRRYAAGLALAALDRIATVDRLYLVVTLAMPGTGRQALCWALVRLANDLTANTVKRDVSTKGGKVDGIKLVPKKSRQVDLEEAIAEKKKPQGFVITPVARRGAQ